MQGIGDIMKFLTVCFIIFYTYELFNQNKFMRDYIASHINEDEEQLKESMNKEKDKMKIIRISCFGFLIAFIIPVIELFYIAFAFQLVVDTTLIYLAWWLIAFAWARYRQKKIKGKYIIKEKHSKYRFKQMVVDLIHLSYFIFMFYILFIK